MFNGIVLCNISGLGLTKNVIYRFVDGKVKNDVGCMRPAGKPIESLDDDWARDRFISVKGM